MRQAILLLFALILTIGASSALPAEQSQQPSIELPAPVARVLTDYERAWQSKDAAALAALFTEDGFVLGSGIPPVRGRASIEKHYTGSGGPLALRALAFATEGSVGYIIGGFARQKGQPDIGKFTLTLRMDKGRWLIMSDMDNMNSAPGRQAAPASIAIRNVNVLPMDREHVLTGQTVIVEGGAVARMGTAEDMPIPPGAFTIDGTGKFLMPGLVDVHVHLASNTEEQQRTLLSLFVTKGVTTVVNLRGNSQILDLRSAVATGTVFGPTIYTSGPFVNEPYVSTPDEVERAVVEQRRAGYDFVKLHGSLSRDAYARLNAVARRESLRVIGHAPRNLGLDVMFEERQYALAHAEEFLYDRDNTSGNFALIEPRIPELAQSMVAAEIWLMPNLTAFKTIGAMVRDLDAVLARPEMRYLPAAVRDGWGPVTNPYTTRMKPEEYQKIHIRYKLLEKLVHEFQSRGVRLLIGTDAMNTGVVPGFSVHDELEDLVAAGLTPFEALRAATANAAEFLGVSGQSGVVRVGQVANLALLDANPLEEIANSRRIAGVMLLGRWIPRAEIVHMLERLAEGASETQDLGR